MKEPKLRPKTFDSLSSSLPLPQRKQPKSSSFDSSLTSSLSPAANGSSLQLHDSLNSDVSFPSTAEDAKYDIPLSSPTVASPRAPPSTSDMEVDGEEVISVVDRVILSNLSRNYSTALIHQISTNYTQTRLQPDPLIETGDTPPDPSWVEPTAFRNYSYYNVHAKGSEQPPNMIHNHMTTRRQTLQPQSNSHSLGLSSHDICHFKVTHHVSVPSTEADTKTDSKDNEDAETLPNTDALSPIGPLASSTSMARLKSDASAIDTLEPPPGLVRSQTLVHKQITMTTEFHGLRVQNANSCHRGSRASEGSKGLRWLFTSVKSETDASSMRREIQREFMVNINALRNHFMRAYARLLCGFEQC